MKYVPYVDCVTWENQILPQTAGLLCNSFSPVISP